jgi:N-acetylneuraminic acid mutarotase
MPVRKHRLQSFSLPLYLLALITISLPAAAQTTAPNEWTWMGGSNAVPQPGLGQPGVYGTMGTPAVGNIPGGRDSAATWTDRLGNFWLFGGSGGDANGSDGYLNDLWEFKPSTNEWTWVSGSSTLPSGSASLPGVYGTLGVPAAGNVPGGRSQSASWIDGNGNLWLFGGEGFTAGTTGVWLNDLWEFNPSTSEWAWMGGSTKTGQPGVYGTLGQAAAGNIPGSRNNAASWTDSSGHFWLFGGRGFDSAGDFGYLNDLWEFNPSTDEWAWMGGSSTLVSTGVESGTYGTLLTPAPANIPGGRSQAVSWTDADGNLWLSSGDGYDASGDFGFLNDLWEFQPRLNEWAWMGGSSLEPCASACGQYGVYGTLGTPAPANIPGGREQAVGWVDSSGGLWLFGGIGAGAPSHNGLLNDLWEFNPSTNEWTWSGGSGSATVFGAYGTLGTPSAGNVPGSRYNANSWTDSNGRLWLFGGNGYDVNGTFGLLNDLWVYEPPALPATATPAFTPAAGTYSTTQTVSITDSTPGATIYYTTNGTTPTTSSTQYTGAITVAASETIQAIAVASGYSASNVASATYTFTLPPAFNLTVTPALQTVTAGQSATFSVSVAPSVGFTSAISFSCSGLPPGATCSFSPATVTPPGTTSTTLTVSTTTADAALHGNPRPLIPIAALAALLSCFGLRKRRRLLHLLILSAVGLGLLTACGGSKSGGVHGAAAYSIAVTATSGTQQDIATCDLTVDSALGL